MLNEDLSKVLGIYYDVIGIPILYMDISGGITIRYPAHIDDHTLINYFEFEEIYEYVNTVFCRNNENLNLDTFYVYQTHHFFTYTVTFHSQRNTFTGAIIFGPMLVCSPDEKQTESIPVYDGMPPDKKSKLLKSIPSVSLGRINNYGELLVALSKSHMENTGSSEHCSLYKTNLAENAKNVFRYSYKFIRDAGKKIIAGDVDGINILLDRSTNVLRYTGSSRDILNSLKNKCITSCMLSCCFAIHKKALYKRMMYMMNDFIDQIETLKTEDEMVTFIIKVIKAYTYEVYASQNTKYSMHINRVLKYIHDHYTEKITLNKLAEYEKISPVYLSSLFMKETNISLSCHINQIRVNKSTELLVFTDKSINEIAFTVGFNYQNHFSAMFKKYTGMTPQEYRKRQAGAFKSIN